MSSGRSMEVELAVRARIALLGRKYADGSLSGVDGARLSTLTERVCRLVPRVAMADFDAIDSIFQELNEIEQRTSDRRDRLGMKP